MRRNPRIPFARPAHAGARHAPAQVRAGRV